MILINGKKRSGKDFSAKLLKAKLEEKGYWVEIMSFADPIKEIISKTFNMSEELLDEFKNDKINLYAYTKDADLQLIANFREILQNFGNEAMKSVFGESVWVLHLLKRITPRVDFVIVPDFRFHSEAQALAPGDKTLKIRNDDLEDDGDTHASETELKDFVFDFEIDNTGQPDITEQIENFIKILICKMKQN